MPPLLRTLRLRDLFLLFIGSVIGSGIFLTPGLILRQLNGSVGFSLLVWIAGGTLSLLGALTYAELAATNPEAGGLYCFIRDGFGRIPAFLYGWCLFLVIASGSVAALARAFTEHLAEIIPLSAVGKTVLSVVMIAVVTAVNVWGTRKSSNLQNWTTLIKVGIIVILSAILLTLGRHAGDLPAAFGTTQHGLNLLSSFGLAMISVLWAYEGWQFGTYSAGEVVNPQKAFPRAFLLGSLVLAGLYIIAVIAYLVALGPAGATASNTIASTSVGVVLGRKAEVIVALTILISTFSAANSVILTAPRVFYAMANDNLFFKKLAEVHPRFQTPAAAILALGCLVRRPGLRRQIRRLDRRGHLHRLDFLRSRRRSNLPAAPRRQRLGHPLPRPRLPLDASALRSRRRRYRRQRYLRCRSRPQTIHKPSHRHSALRSRLAGLLVLAQTRRYRLLNQLALNLRC